MDGMNVAISKWNAFLRERSGPTGVSHSRGREISYAAGVVPARTGGAKLVNRESGCCIEMKVDIVRVINSGDSLIARNILIP